jgi:serine/threonine-protein kinase RsbW
MADGKAPLFRRSAPARLDEVPRLCREAREALAGVNLTPESSYGVELVLEEILTNEAKYAYPAGGAGTVELEIEGVRDALLLRFRDAGAPFDPLSVPPPPPALQRERPGGLGISLVRSVAGAVRYRREGETNVLEVEIPTA